MSFTVRIDDAAGERTVHVAGTLDVHNATEFSHMVRQLGQAFGTTASFDMRELLVVDAAGRAAVRTFVRDAEEFGGAVILPVAAGA